MIVIVFYEKNWEGKLQEVTRMMGEPNMDIDRIKKLAAEKNLWFGGGSKTLLLAEYGEYFEKNCKNAGGYTSCPIAIEVRSNQIINWRETTPEEIKLVDHYHGRFSVEDREKMAADHQYGIAINIRGQWVEVGLSKLAIMLKITEDEILRMFREEQPTKKGTRYVYYMINKYKIRKRKEN